MITSSFYCESIFSHLLQFIIKEFIQPTGALGDNIMYHQYVLAYEIRKLKNRSVSFLGMIKQAKYYEVKFDQQHNI